MKEVSIGSEEMTGVDPVSASISTEASEPGSLDRLSEELSVFIGRGGTIGGGCLNRFGGTDPGSADGESCSLEREYLRKWLPPVAMRFGFSLVPSLLLLLGLVSLSFACC